MADEATSRLSPKEWEALSLPGKLGESEREPTLQALGGSGVSGLYEVATWLVYALAAVMMLPVIAAVILAGLALRFVAEFLRELGDSREEGDTHPVENNSPAETSLSTTTAASRSAPGR